MPACVQLAHDHGPCAGAGMAGTVAPITAESAPMPLTRLGFILRQFSRRLWVRAAAFALLGVAAAMIGRFLGPYLPKDVLELSGAQSVRGLLNILASSMLAVTTFSLSIMVQAYGAAAAAVTPRAVDLLLQDRTSQTVLSTFLGAFLFALVGLIALEAGAYGDPGQVVLFFATVAVTVAVVIAMLGWISHLTSFGRLGDTTQRVEQAAQAALCDRLVRPGLGGIASPVRPAGLVAVMAQDTGYLRHIDVPHLQELAETMVGASARGVPVLYLDSLPGAFVHPGAVLLWRSADLAEGCSAEALDRDLREAFTTGDTRSFDQDPRFGFCVLSEIASRALSPAVNDPGTAIDVLGRVVRVLAQWNQQTPQAARFLLVAVPPLDIDDLLDDVFPAIAQDGAGNFSVQIRLQKTLLALAQLAPPTFAAAAARQSARALVGAQGALVHEADLAALQAVSDDLARLAGQTDGQRRKL